MKMKKNAMWKKSTLIRLIKSFTFTIYFNYLGSSSSHNSVDSAWHFLLNIPTFCLIFFPLCFSFCIDLLYIHSFCFLVFHFFLSFSFFSAYIFCLFYSRIFFVDSSPNHCFIIFSLSLSSELFILLLIFFLSKRKREKEIDR